VCEIPHDKLIYVDVSAPTAQICACGLRPCACGVGAAASPKPGSPAKNTPATVLFLKVGAIADQLQPAPENSFVRPRAQPRQRPPPAQKTSNTVTVRECTALGMARTITVLERTALRTGCTDAALERPAPATARWKTGMARTDAGPPCASARRAYPALWNPGSGATLHSWTVSVTRQGELQSTSRLRPYTIGF
jgi:hypothetical protein